MSEESENKKGEEKKPVEVLSAKTIRELLTKESIDERFPVLDAYDRLAEAKKIADLEAQKLQQDLEETQKKLVSAQDSYRKLFLRIPVSSEEDPTDPLGVKRKLSNQPMTLADMIEEARGNQ